MHELLGKLKLCSRLNLCKSPRRCNQRFHGPFFQVLGRLCHTQTNWSHHAAITVLLNTQTWTLGLHPCQPQPGWRICLVGAASCSLHKNPELSKSRGTCSSVRHLTACSIYFVLPLQTILRSNVMVLGGGFNEKFNSWGKQVSQLSWKPNYSF